MNTAKVFSGLVKNYVAASSNTAFSLREMVPADEPHFRRLYAQMRAAEFAVVDWPEAAKLAFYNSQYDLQDAHYRKFYATFTPLAICVGDVPIGRLYLATVDSLCLLMDIIVDPNYQKQGIASTILTALCAHADANAQAINLHVEPLNPARRLYGRFGFVDLPNQTDAQLNIEMRRNGS